MEERPFKRVRLEGLQDGNLPLQTRGHEFGSLEAKGSAIVQQGDQFGIQNHYHCSQHSAHTTTSTNEDKYEKLHKSLFFPRMDARVLNVSKALPDTCEWLFQHNQFKEWQTGRSIAEHNGFLWIKGKPGCGKSTIMKNTLEWAQKQVCKKSSEKVVYYFFNARAFSSLEKSTLGFYRSLVYQLLDMYISLRSLFTNKFALKDPEDPGDSWTRKELENFLCDMAHSDDSYSVCILVDALDEGEDESDVRDMINFLVDLSERALDPSSSLKLRICLSSRHYPHISIKKGLSLVVEEQNEHNRDIEIYVRKKLIGQTKLMTSDSSAKEDLVTEVCRKSASIFLWVVLVVRMLDKLEDHPGLVTDMRIRLDEIPTDLNELFAEILKKSDHGIDACIALLQWVLFSMRPLEPSELYLATEYSRPPADPTWTPSQPIVVPPEDRCRIYITDCSRGLVELTSADPPVVQFIHETVRDYLVQPHGLASLEPDLWSNLRGKSHEFLKIGCLRYILRCCTVPEEYARYITEGHRDKQSLESIKDKLNIEMPFINYSVSHLFGHSEQAQTYGISQMEFLRDRMIEENGEWDSWERAWWNVFERFGIRKYARYTTLLYFLVEQGFVSLIEQSLKISKPINTKCGKYGSALQAACAIGNEEIVQTLIAHGAHINTICGVHKHVLLAAIYTKNFFLVPILRKHRAHLEQRLLRKPLFEMIARGSVQGVTLLLELGANNKWLNSRQESPLELAMLSKRFEIVDLLLLHGFDFGMQLSRQNGENILRTAISNGLTQIVDLLIKAGLDVNANNGANLLHAMDKGHIEIVRLLIKNGAAVNAINSNAIQNAARAGYIEIVRLLIENGADVNADNGIVMVKAIEGGDIEIVRLLIENGTNVSANDSIAILHAILKVHVEILRLLIKNGADVNTRNGNAIRNASRGGYTEIVRLLIENGANVNTKEKGDGETTLYIASCKGYEDIVQLLIDNGADVNAQVTAYGSPLMAAAYGSHEKIVQMLIKHGADVNAQGGSYGTALQAACYLGNGAMARLLIKNGADVNAQGGKYGSALQAACYGRHETIASLLIENGADINTQGAEYGTALQTASCFGDTGFVRLLLKNGADVNFQSGKYGSALGAASHSCDIPMVRLLIENGADVNLRGGRDNESPIEMACRKKAEYPHLIHGHGHGYSKIIQILHDVGAEEPPAAFFESLKAKSEC